MLPDGGKEFGLGRPGADILIGDIIRDGLRLLGSQEMGGRAVHADNCVQSTVLPTGWEREGRKREERRVPHFQTSMGFVHTLAGAQGDVRSRQLLDCSAERELIGFDLDEITTLGLMNLRSGERITMQ